MLRYAALILLFANLAGLLAQPAAILDANNIKAGFGANGALFEGGLVAPKTSLLKSISAARFWIAGINSNTSALHLSAQAGDNNPPAFWPGPLDTVNSNAADTALWDTIFTVTAAEITNHIQNWNKPGYIVPDAIKYWPGSNTAPGFKKIVAPFVDFNANSFYEPELGEYPYIKGDQAAYFICNDKANTHLGLPLGVEVHGMAYVFSNTAGLENVVFLELGFINRSANNYTNVYTGIYTDFALGDVNDDYAGTFPQKNAFYVYNSTAKDSQYGTNPPVQAVMFLNRPLDYSIQIDPSATSGSDTNRGFPVVPQEYYNFLQGKWRDGSPIHSSGNGYKTVTQTSPYIFTGDPCNGDTGWIESSSSLPPGRRILLGSAGPFTLGAKDYIKLDIAFIWSGDTTSAKGSVCKMLSDADAVRAFYNKSISSTPKVEKTLTFTVYPNPVNETLHISVDETLSANALITINDLQGREIAEIPAVRELEIPVSHLQPGVYFVNLSSGAASSVQKLLIQR